MVQGKIRAQSPHQQTRARAEVCDGLSLGLAKSSQIWEDERATAKRTQMLELNEVHQGDCLELMRRLPDCSVDLICTDPPFFKTKSGKGVDGWWDNQWDKPSEFLAWIDQLAEQWQRILKPNGSLYCFASAKMSAHVEVELGRRFNVLNNITWVKPDGSGAEKGARGGLTTKYIYQSEKIIFCESQFPVGRLEHQICDTPMSLYISSLRKAAGLSCTELTELVRGRKTGLCWLWENPLSPGGCIPSFEDFEKIHIVCKKEKDLSFSKYEELCFEPEEIRIEKESLRQEYESLRRPFNVTADVPYTDVWTFPTVQSYSGKHPCEKPQELISHIINASSRPGAVVLDCFAGSGSTLVAAQKLGRQYIGMEIDPHWIAQCRQRLGDFSAQPIAVEDRLAWLETQVKAQSKKIKKLESGQLSLFEQMEIAS